MIGRYGRFEDAMIAQAALLEHSNSAVGERMLRSMGVTLNAQQGADDRMPGDWMVALQRQTLAMAEPVFVSQDVTEVVDHARATFHPEDVWASDAFTPFGFALPPRAIMLSDAEANAQDHVAVRSTPVLLVCEDCQGRGYVPAETAP